MNRIYHITPLHNLPSIIEAGCIWRDAEMLARGLRSTGIAHPHIKERRSKKEVNCGPGGFIADYTPFYFAPRSPMLGAIHTGKVQGFTGTQGQILHLVVRIGDVVNAGLPFVFTDGHAPMDLSQQYADPSDLDKINWQVMDEPMWNDTDEFPDRKRQRQAEFLVHRSFPWSLILGIGVINEFMAERVQTLLENAVHQPVVKVKENWYY